MPVRVTPYLPVERNLGKTNLTMSWTRCSHVDFLFKEKKKKKKKINVEIIKLEQIFLKKLLPATFFFFSFFFPPSYNY